jgi:hypothetical protein
VPTYVLGTFYIRFLVMYQGYESRKNCKPSCTTIILTQCSKSMHRWNPLCKGFILSHFDGACCVGKHCVLIHTIVRKSLVKYCAIDSKRHPKGIPRRERVNPSKKWLDVQWMHGGCSGRAGSVTTAVVEAKKDRCANTDSWVLPWLSVYSPTGSTRFDV